jgi:acyl-CoA reductase-like NAD-dependent aldehyde dehydrogenase
MVMVNVPNTGVDLNVPSGGGKDSSCGPCEQGKYAAELSTQLKTAYIAVGYSGAPALCQRSCLDQALVSGE